MSRLLVFLTMCIPTCTTGKMACHPHQSMGYEAEVWQCSGTKVNYVPRYLPRTLQALFMTGTSIPSLDEETFRGRDLKELKTLHLSGGQLTSVGPRTFCPLPALVVLHLDRNQLEVLDELSFSCNSFLRTVNLADNPKLHQLPQLVSHSVENLYLDNCSLTSIDVSTFELMPALKVLSLTGNPDLHRPSLILRFTHAQPGLLVIRKDPPPQLASLAFPDNEQHTTELLIESDSLNKYEQNGASSIPLPITAIAAVYIFIIIPFQ